MTTVQLCNLPGYSLKYLSNCECLTSLHINQSNAVSLLGIEQCKNLEIVCASVSMPILLNIVMDKYDADKHNKMW